MLLRGEHQWQAEVLADRVLQFKLLKLIVCLMIQLTQALLHYTLKLNVRDTSEFLLPLLLQFLLIQVTQDLLHYTL